MNPSLALLVPALLLAACAGPAGHDTGGPAYLDQPAAAGASSPPACTLASRAYSHGAVSCQDGVRYRCENGIWNHTFRAC